MNKKRLPNTRVVKLRTPRWREKEIIGRRLAVWNYQMGTTWELKHALNDYQAQLATSIK